MELHNTELKVWCDGIQRIVCGATKHTTCEDVVFALAHATGQTGRFIMLQQWKNKRRILSPTDHPLLILAECGEYANEVSFELKKSGDIKNIKDFNSELNKLNLITKRNQYNMHNTFPRSLSSDTTLMLNSIETNHSPHINSTSCIQTNTSSQQQQQMDNFSLKNKNDNRNMIYSSNVLNEPLYGSLNKNRPRQPPPYKEAIAKSSLVNLIHNSSHPLNMVASHQRYKLNENNFNTKVNLLSNNQSLIDSNVNQQLQQTISISQKSNQSKSLDNKNGYLGHRYKEEMDMLQQQWLEQEMLIEKLESENLENEMEKLLNDGKHYENEIREIKIKLSNCENEIIKRREEICKLMNKIEDYFYLNTNEYDNLHDLSLMDNLKVSLQEKSNQIQDQKIDLNLLNDSLENFDRTIQTKNNFVDELLYQIKEANVEGLKFQSAILSSEDKCLANIDTATYLKSGINRRIPVSLHELGNTVPTKKNPDGIWV